jgi:threonine aldolase
MDYSDAHCARTRVVCIENTHNNCGGRALPIKFMEDLKDLCSKYGIKIHLDGSRLLNASLACHVGVNQLAKHCDSINFCFSKVR